MTALTIDKLPCLECGAIAMPVGGKKIYPHRHDLFKKKYYLCECGAYCGSHADSGLPLGNPCGAETRKQRMRAHTSFDKLWKRKITKEGISKTKARRAGYAWLAEQMGMPPAKCHISMMTKDEAAKVVKICEPFQ